MKSKKGDGSQFIALEHEGDEQYLNIENDAVANALKNLKGKSVTIEASGAREDAALTVKGAQSSGNAPSASSGSQEGSRQPDDHKTHLARFVKGYLAALEAADIVQQTRTVEGKEMTPEQFQAATSTFFITLDRRGALDSIEIEDKPF